MLPSPSLPSPRISPSASLPLRDDCSRVFNCTRVQLAQLPHRPPLLPAVFAGLGRVLEPWFAVGSWFGIVALIVAPIMLAVSAFSSTTAIVSSISQSVSGAAGAAMTVTPTVS